jgi:hypothetical protein
MYCKYISHHPNFKTSAAGLNIWAINRRDGAIFYTLSRGDISMLSGIKTVAGPGLLQYSLINTEHEIPEAEIRGYVP